MVANPLHDVACELLPQSGADRSSVTEEGRDGLVVKGRVLTMHPMPRLRYHIPVTHLAAMDLWAYTNGVILDFSRRGKPTDNATIESFNGRFRKSV